MVRYRWVLVTMVRDGQDVLSLVLERASWWFQVTSPDWSPARFLVGLERIGCGF